MLNILNYSDHPTRIGFVVFRFYEKNRSVFFAELLKKEGVFYEFSFEEENKLFLFGIRKGDFKAASRANYLVSANFRNKIIPNLYLRWGVIVFSMLMLGLALIGFLLRV